MNFILTAIFLLRWCKRSISNDSCGRKCQITDGRKYPTALYLFIMLVLITLTNLSNCEHFTFLSWLNWSFSHYPILIALSQYLLSFLLHNLDQNVIINQYLYVHTCLFKRILCVMHRLSCNVCNTVLWVIARRISAIFVRETYILILYFRYFC